MSDNSFPAQHTKGDREHKLAGCDGNYQHERISDQPPGDEAFERETSAAAAL